MIKELIEAVCNGDVDKTSTCLKKGADVNDTRGKLIEPGNHIVYSITPLFLAIYQNYAGVAEILISAGAHVNHASSNGKTPLMHAFCTAKNPTLIKLLLANGAALFTQDNQNLIIRDHLKIWKQNITNQRDQHQNIDNEIASYSECIRIYNAAQHLFLLAMGKMPLPSITPSSGSDFIQSLLNKGAHFNQRVSDEDFSTPLHIACQYNNATVVKAMITVILTFPENIQSQILSAKNSDGDTAYDIAFKASDTHQLIMGYLEYALQKTVHHVVLESTALCQKLSMKSGRPAVTLNCDLLMHIHEFLYPSYIRSNHQANFVNMFHRMQLHNRMLHKHTASPAKSLSTIAFIPSQVSSRKRAPSGCLAPT